MALGAPSGLALDPAGNLFIGDIGLNRILKLAPDGTIRSVAGTGKQGFSGDGGPGTAGEIFSPRSLAVDRAGNLFWAEAANKRVRRLGADGLITTVAGSGPFGLGVPGSFAGDGGPATEARLWGPSGVAIDVEGNLLIADQNNNRIRKVIGIAAPGLIAGQ